MKRFLSMVELLFFLQIFFQCSIFRLNPFLFDYICAYKVWARRLGASVCVHVCVCKCECVCAIIVECSLPKCYVNLFISGNQHGGSYFKQAACTERTRWIWNQETSSPSLIIFFATHESRKRVGAGAAAAGTAAVVVAAYHLHRKPCPNISCCACNKLVQRERKIEPMRDGTGGRERG